MNFERATISCMALGLLFQGCGKDEEKAADKNPISDTKTEVKAPAKVAPAKIVKKENPAPPDDVYEGKARVVNLATIDGKPVSVDVWAKRSFKYAPVKLAENVAFGEATEWFKSPKGSPVTVFQTGTGPDSKEDLGGIFHPQAGEHITAIFYNKEDGKPTSGNYWDTSDDPEKAGTPDAPQAGKGYVILRAGQLTAHKKTLADTVGGWAIRVGDGKGKCLHQRTEDLGYQAAILGGTQPVELDLDPGTQTISIHKRSSYDCSKAGQVYEFNVEVKADKAQFVAVYTVDGKTLKHSAFDMPVNSAKPYGTNKKLKEVKDAERAAKEAAKAAEKEKETK